MSAPLGPAGEVKENLADDICEQEPEAFEIISVSMVVPKGSGDHYLSSIIQTYRLAHTAIDIKGYLEEVPKEQWNYLKWKMDFNADMFKLGEWVEINRFDIDDNISMVPDFVPHTKGQIIGIRWGWSTPYLVAIETPVTETNDTEWSRNDAKPYIAFYYCWHDLRRLNLEEVPEQYRDSANQCFPVEEENKSELKDLAQKIVQEILNEPDENMYRRNARLRLEQLTKTTK